MALEKLFSNFKKNFKRTAAAITLTAFLCSCGGSSSSNSKPEPEYEPPGVEETEPESSGPTYNYTTTITNLNSEYIDAFVGGAIEVNDSDSLLYGTKLIIPGGALDSDATISIGQVNNPPALPEGLNYIGPPVNLQSDGANLDIPATITIPYTDAALSDAGISDDSDLKLYYYDKNAKSPNSWKEVNGILLNIANNKLMAEIGNLSTYYAVTGGFDIPEDLGNPQPGDLLYKLGLFFDDGNVVFQNAWMPGHVGIYVGEKVDKEGNKYNVVEALWGEGVTRNYFNPISEFSREDVYMGAREPKDFSLTLRQREDIVDFVEAQAQVGKPYAKWQTAGIFFGMLEGKYVKGPYSYNCVGLAEKAYEEAGVNEGDGLVSEFDEGNIGCIPGNLQKDALTPAEQYNATKPAKGQIFYIGDRGPAGGWIFYDKGNYSNGWRYLEVVQVDLPKSAWGTAYFNVSGADGTTIGTGEQNTLDIITNDPLPDKAADECANYSVVNKGVIYDDWFLPSKDELNQIYLNLVLEGIGNFPSYNYYWSSSESTNSNNNSAWYQFLMPPSGSQYIDYKYDKLMVRPIRAF